MGVAARMNFDIDCSDLDRGSGQDGDLLSLLEALDVRIAAGLNGLRADAGARDHLAQARELISRTLRRADLSALSLNREEPAAAAGSKELCSGGLPPRRARQVTEYIRLRLAERISVNELAGIAGLSRSYFCRAFRATFHVSPRQFIEARRIEQAQRLMLETDGSLLQIALACGFGEAAHFSKTFRSAMGLSPSRWRRIHRD
jgi:AraC-like DNA-binding protein